MGGGYGSAVLLAAMMITAFISPAVSAVLLGLAFADLLWIASRRRK
jgi:hypothetical protein